MHAPPPLSGIDHLVLTVASLDATCAFYARALGMETEVFRAADGAPRRALRFAGQKINLHAAGAEFEPKAERPTPGSADICLLTEAPLADWIAHLREAGVAVESGPVARTGARGRLMSIYLRDPDRNLIEIARHEPG